MQMISEDKNGNVVTSNTSDRDEVFRYYLVSEIAFRNLVKWFESMHFTVISYPDKTCYIKELPGLIWGLKDGEDINLDLHNEYIQMRPIENGYMATVEATVLLTDLLQCRKCASNLRGKPSKGTTDAI